MGDTRSAELDVRREVADFLTSFTQNMKAFEQDDKPIASDIYEPIYHLFYGLSFQSPEHNSVATQGFATGVLVSLLMREEFRDKADLARDVSLHYGAAFWDAVANTLVEAQERLEQAQEDSTESNDEAPTDADA